MRYIVDKQAGAKAYPFFLMGANGERDCSKVIIIRGCEARSYNRTDTFVDCLSFVSHSQNWPGPKDSIDYNSIDHSYEFSELAYRVAEENMELAITDPIVMNQHLMLQKLWEIAYARLYPAAESTITMDVFSQLDVLLMELSEGEYRLVASFGDMTYCPFELEHPQDVYEYGQLSMIKSANNNYREADAYATIADILARNEEKSTEVLNPNKYTLSRYFDKKERADGVALGLYQGPATKELKLWSKYGNGDVVSVDALYTNDTACSLIKKVIIPDTVVNLGPAVFKKLTSLQKVELPDKITAYPNEMFAECTSLTKFSFPSAVQKVADFMFDGCIALRTIDIGEATEVGQGAFRNCTSLKKIKSKKLVRIGNGAFEGCTNLTELKISKSIMEITDSCFKGTGITKLVVPANVLMIGNEAFADCANLETIVFTGEVKLHSKAFSNCTSLKRVEFAGPFELSSTTFEGCDAISEIVLPEGLEESVLCKQLAWLPDGKKQEEAISLPVEALIMTMSEQGNHYISFCMEPAMFEQFFHAKVEKPQLVMLAGNHLQTAYGNQLYKFNLLSRVLQIKKVPELVATIFANSIRENANQNDAIINANESLKQQLSSLLCCMSRELFAQLKVANQAPSNLVSYLFYLSIYLPLME